jgi:multiple sugar transport system ATP-binding protein
MEVRFEKVHKSFGDVVAVEDLDLVVQDGEFLVLLGPSGCGKTTSLRMLAGLEEVTGGRIFIGERDVTRAEPRERDVAMVFQSYALYPHMSVADNIGYPLRIRKVSEEERKERVRRAAEMLEIAHLLDRSPRQLSGGQSQRVALGRAIVRNPSAFLMDEPLSNLDALLRQQMRGELRHLQASLGVTCIYVTHDQEEAMTLGDRIVVMKDGLIQQVGSPEDIYGSPASTFVAGFIGKPPMNLVRGRIGGDGAVQLSSGTLPLGQRAAPASNRAVIVGLRAQDMRLVGGDDGDLGGRLYVVEDLGDEVLATVEMGDERVRVRCDRGFRARVDQDVRVSVNAEHVYLFDPESGEAL